MGNESGYSPITIARFWSKVDVRPDNDDCWEWQAGTKGAGYGILKVDGNVKIASRMAWELINGEPLGSRHALHSCDNPRCCNPHHIAAGTHEENMRQAGERGRSSNGDQAGSSNNRAKLSDRDILRIRSLIAAGLTNVEIAKRYSVTHSMISRIRTGRSWNGTKTK
ncbi:HNH endonuclease [Dinoroseobacter sp. S375]|uniref:HNH endonuclease n=1 Tax=Dinoroseobacter sp. S375 TaxID=3415136 RepID=UPI003C7C0CEE